MTKLVNSDTELEDTARTHSEVHIGKNARYLLQPNYSTLSIQNLDDHVKIPTDRSKNDPK